jgi:homocysteine S-methyltransferase
MLDSVEDAVFLTDSGIETDIIFSEGHDLPAFALYPLLDEPAGRDTLSAYYSRHLAVAAEHGLGYVLETPTWRSNPDWGRSLGYSQDQLDDFDRDAVAFMRTVRQMAPSGLGPSPISGLIGPRGDGYVVGEAMAPDEAQRYHEHQVGVFAAAGCDLVSGCTFTHAGEAIGLVRAAQQHGVPCVIYFTVETDGRLPDGSSLGAAIEAVDEATGSFATHYGINCAHPDHIVPALASGGAWTSRIGALRSNASRLSHAELDVAEELDSGNPEELAADYVSLRFAIPQVRVFGGCCGTDVRHVRAIARAVAPPNSASVLG